MSYVFIVSEDGDNIIAMDIEESISVSRSNQITQSSVMSGKNSSDGYHEGNKRIALQGTVTYNKVGSLVGGSALNPLEFQAQIDNLVSNQTRFKLYGNDLISDLENCVIESDSVTIGKYTDCVDVTLGLQQVFVSKAAVESILIVPKKSVKPEISSSTESGDGSKSEVETSVLTDVLNYFTDDSKENEDTTNGT